MEVDRGVVNGMGGLSGVDLCMSGCNWGEAARLGCGEGE